MKQYPFFTSVFVTSAWLFLSACAPAVPGPIPTTSAVAPGVTTDSIPTVTAPPATTTPVLTESQAPEGALVVAFVKDGDIHLWAESNQQSRTLVTAGDVTSVMTSDDGQVIAFLRRALVEQPELMEYVSLWAMGSNGQN